MAVAEYLERTTSRSDRVAPGETLSIRFSPKNPGPVHVFGQPDMKSRGRAVKRRVVLLAPGSSRPVAQRTGAGDDGTTMLSHKLTRKDTGGTNVWQCQIKNLEDKPADLKLSVAYPGTIPIESYRVPSAMIENLLASLLHDVELRLTRGREKSYLKMTGGPSIRFTVPDFKKKVLLMTVEQYPNDIRSDNIEVKFVNATNEFPHGAVRLTTTFRSTGREILGTFHAKLKDMQLVAEIGLAMDKGRISYDRTRIQLNFKLDIVGIPDWLLDPIIGYSDKIKTVVESEMQKRLHSPEIKRAFSDHLTDGVRRLLPPSGKLRSLRIANNNVVVKYYQP
jgi:hypothetical protein